MMKNSYRLVALVLGGFALGTATPFLKETIIVNSVQSGGLVALGVVVVISLVLSVFHRRRASQLYFQLDVFSLWAAFAIGLCFAYGKITDDIVGVTIMFWIPLAIVGGLIVSIRFSRREGREPVGFLVPPRILKGRVLPVFVILVLSVGGLYTKYAITYEKTAKANIEKAILLIDKYKEEHGKYPDSLRDVPGARNTSDRILGIFRSPPYWITLVGYSYVLSYTTLADGINCYSIKTKTWNHFDDWDEFDSQRRESEVKRFVAPIESQDGCQVVNKAMIRVPLPEYLEPVVEKLCSYTDEKDCLELKEKTKSVARRSRQAHGFAVVDNCFTKLLTRVVNPNREGRAIGVGSLEMKHSRTLEAALSIEGVETLANSENSAETIAEIERFIESVDAGVSEGETQVQLANVVFEKCRQAYVDANEDNFEQAVANYFGAADAIVESYELEGKSYRKTGLFRDGVELMKTIAKPMPYIGTSGYPISGLSGIPKDSWSINSSTIMDWEEVDAELVGVEIVDSWIPTEEDLRAFEKGIGKFLSDSGSEVVKKLDSSARRYAGITAGGQPMLYVRILPSGLYGCSGCRYQISPERERLDSVFFNLATGEYCGLANWW